MASHQALESHEVSRAFIGSDDDIFKAAAVCRRLFQEYLQNPRLFGKQVTEFQRRFLTWAGFLGVFAPASVCLDTRLASVPEMKELVISMLTVLRRNLERGTGLLCLETCISLILELMIGLGIKRHRLVA